MWHQRNFFHYFRFGGKESFFTFWEGVQKGVVNLSLGYSVIAVGCSVIVVGFNLGRFLSD